MDLYLRIPRPNPSPALGPRAVGLQGPFGWAAEGRHSCSSSVGDGGLTHVQQCDVREGERGRESLNGRPPAARPHAAPPSAPRRRGYPSACAPSFLPPSKGRRSPDGYGTLRSLRTDGVTSLGEEVPGRDRMMVTFRVSRGVGYF